MYLGRGRINLREELPLEGCERKAYTNAFEYSLIHEEKGGPTPGSVVHTNRFPWPAGADGNVGIMGAAEGIEVV